MKRYKCFMVMAAMVALMLPCNASEAVQAAATAAAENMTGKNIAKLYKVRTEAENPDQCEVIIQACIAGLYAIGDTKNAKKINQGENRDRFIDSLMKECDLCHGEGRSQEGCYKCKGSGACQNRKCNNGTVTTAGFDGRSNVRKCSNCGGSGRCTNCKGIGKVARTCSRCNGSKKVIDKSIALASCKDMLNALIACGNEIQSRKKAEGATQLAQQMVEKEKQAREKAESNARLAVQNAENEKRQRKQAEESVRLAQQKADSERHARVKAEGDVRIAQQNAENERRAREKAEGDARLAEQNAKDEKSEREKAEETARLAQSNAEREKHAREEAEFNARLAEQGAQNEKRQREQAEESARLAQQKAEDDKRTSEKVEADVRLARAKAESEKKVSGGAVANSNNAKGSGQTHVVMPANMRSLKEAFPNSYKTIESVVIQDGVTRIEGSAFKDCSNLKSVAIPNSVTRIDHEAFSGCSGLMNVTIPDSVTHIYGSAFEGCSGLTSVVIPDSVTYFDTCAFADCSGLTKVVIGKNVRSFGSDLFKGCSEVTSVTLPARKRLSSMFPDAYETIQSVVIQDGETSIVDRAFSGCNGLTSVMMPNSVTSIGSLAFEGCTGLTSVVIPDSVTDIGHSTFEGCVGLTSIVIPDSVARIYHSAFKGCIGLTSVTIPDNLEIDINAFGDCYGLTNVVIGKNVTGISSAFDGCSGVTSVTMPACKPLSWIFRDAYKTIQSVVIQDGETSIVHDAFRDCAGLTSVTIPNSVTSIGYGAFNGCSGLTSVTIPDSVTSIGDGAFRRCTGLTSVVIPNSVTSIDSDAFLGCSALTSVTLPQSLEKLGSRAFEKCEKLEFFGNKEFKGGDISTEAFAGTQYTVVDIDGVKCIKSTKDAVQIKQKVEFEKDLAKITSERKCDGDCCEISANSLTVGVINRKSGGFNYIVSGRCNGVSNRRLYYKDWNGWTQTEDVDWNYDFNYMMLSDENEWTNWMDALKVIHVKVIEWVDLAAKNDIDKVEKEIPIGGIEVLAHSNLITKGKGQRELYLSAIRECVHSDTPVKFFCKMSRKNYKEDKGEYSGGVVARCGYFEHEILRFSGDKTHINNDILLLIERYNPASLKKAYVQHASKQDMFK